MKPDSAMVFAAGFGTRLGELVRDTPKPLIKVAGRPLINHALDIVDAAAVTRCAVNLHYHADKLAAYLENRPELFLLHEFPDVLDTGGGLLNAVDALGNGPVFTLNSDTVWSGANPLLELAESRPPGSADALLLLVPPESANGHQGGGDFVFTENARIRRAGPGERGFVFTGAQIIDTGCLARIGKKIFSFNEVWDRLIPGQRLAGVVHCGEIGDAGTPAGLKACEEMLAGRVP